jgi:hypothetical protein
MPDYSSSPHPDQQDLRSRVAPQLYFFYASDWEDGS